MEHKSRCDDLNTCVFDPGCEGILDCYKAEPSGSDMYLKVYVLDEAMRCDQSDCEHGDDYVIPLKARRVTIAEIIEAVNEHREKYSN